MILSHRHRFIFLAVPKTGTHAVRFALRAHLAPEDEEQVQLFVRSALSHPAIARLVHGHVRWNEARDALGAELWESRFKFAFVRNPWARFVSYCAFVSRDNGRFAADPRATMRLVLDSPDHHQRIIFRPQHEFICDADGNVMVDYVGRQETMQASYDDICRHIGLPPSELSRVNASAHGPWRDYYDSELAERIARIYAKDIACFGYRFET